ncbi:MAG: serine/threonine protein kinase [Lachnospiraceae bacterium]|nr:serine/threonine protein kinase [Lachnospiraceae bacterium]
MKKVIEKGTVVNKRYEVIGPIGSGGTSDVYLVADRHIGRTLAMKVMDRKCFGAFRFARSEIEALRCIHFPLFPAIHDAFCDSESIFILSEYVKGISLGRMCMGKGMPKDRALAIAERICEALMYLHGLKKPMLYLDLKPDNIIVDAEGLPHLIDFGIAGWIAAGHMPVGTVGYSPPEQYQADGGMDVRTDIFAFGMTYYAIRTGVPPDPDPDTARECIRKSHILRPSEKSFLLRCCAFSKEDRYTCVSEVRKQIRHIRTIPDRFRKRTVITAVVLGVLIGMGYAARTISTRIRQSEASADLVRRATQHMEEGMYTPEGIGIIKACINSGNLPDETEQEFIFEVAVNAMLVAKDYRTAAAYFARLDTDKYPEAADYMELCALQNGFGHDPAKALTVIGKLLMDTAGLAPSKMKYENMIFIAGCYENYDADPAEGAAKALSVLRTAASEIDEITKEEERKDSDELASIRRRIDELMAVKERRLKARMYRAETIGGTNEE